MFSIILAPSCVLFGIARIVNSIVVALRRRSVNRRMRMGYQTKFTKKMMKKYPHMFEVSDYMPIRCHGIQTPIGWNKLVAAMLKSFSAHVQIHQLKAKFGQIRMYGVGMNVADLELMSEYANRSQTVCEECGKLGRLRSNGQTTYVGCEKHIKE